MESDKESVLMKELMNRHTHLFKKHKYNRY